MKDIGLLIFKNDKFCAMNLNDSIKTPKIEKKGKQPRVFNSFSFRKINKKITKSIIERYVNI